MTPVTKLSGDIPLGRVDLNKEQFFCRLAVTVQVKQLLLCSGQRRC